MSVLLSRITKYLKAKGIYAKKKKNVKKNLFKCFLVIIWQKLIGIFVRSVYKSSKQVAGPAETVLIK